MKKILYSMLFVAGWFGLMSSGCGGSGGGSSSVNTVAPGTSGGVGVNGSTARFAINHDKLYAIHHDTLKVVNIALPENLTIEHEMYIGTGIETMYPFNNFLYIASNNGVYAYSLANPRIPVRQNFVSHVTGCDPVVANSTHMFLTIHGGTNCRGNNINELQIFKLGQNNSATWLKTIPMKNPLGLGLSGNALYVCDRTNELAVFDISQPSATQKVNVIKNIDFVDVIPYNNLLVCGITGGLRYYDISNEMTPIFLSEVKN